MTCWAARLRRVPSFVFVTTVNYVSHYISENKVVIKINAPKRKSQIRLSPKRLSFSKNVYTRNFLVIDQNYNRFCLKLLRSTLQNLGIAIFGQIWFNLVVFSLFDQPKSCFTAKWFSRKLPDQSEPTERF